MTNQLLLNDNLKDFIEKLNISQEQKDALFTKLPQLDKKQRPIEILIYLWFANSKKLYT